MTEQPWRDEQTLRNLYSEKGLPQTEIAERFGCNRSTVKRWLDKFGIDTNGVELPGRYVIVQYFEDGKSLYDLADQYGCSPSKIKRHFEKYGISRRSKSEAAKLNEIPEVLVDSGAPERVYEEMRSQPANLTVTLDGHLMWRIPSDEKYHAIGVHRIVALANGEDPHKVFSGGEYHVHHKNGVPWDNRPENLEVLTKSEHHSLHNDPEKELEYGE